MGILELIAAVLFGIFAYMKVAEKGSIAEWSWWRVTSPLWIYAIVMGVITLLAIFGIGAMMSIPAAGF